MNIHRSSAVRFVLASTLVVAGAVGSATAKAADKFDIGEGAYQLPAPAGWISKPPRTKIVEHEFEVPAVEGDPMPGRVTVMGAGGSIDDNIDRWCGQFSQTDESSTRDTATKITKQTIAGQEVTVVDIHGTYEDKAIPFAPGPGTPRENYRMLSAIIQTKKAGNYFIKLYGPAKTVAQNEAGFMKMLEGLEAK